MFAGMAAAGNLKVSFRSLNMWTILSMTSPSSTILETCEEAGIPLPVVCRAGVCGSCRKRLADGRVRCESDLLDANDRADGYILPCVSWPEEDCALEA